jgi:hypothetical protein
MATRAWLIREILTHLGVAQAGNDLPPEDWATVERNLDYFLLELGERDIFQVPDRDNIPDRAASSLAAWLASKYVNHFGLVGEDRQTLSAGALEAATTLRYMRAGEPTYVPMRHESF